MFDSGDETFRQQWDEINSDYNLNRRQPKEVFEDSDIDDAAEEEPNDDKVAKNLKVGKKVEY